MLVPKTDGGGRMIDRSIERGSSFYALVSDPPKRPLNPASVPLIPDTTAIDLDVTDGCNLACRYCFKNLDTPHNMSLQTAKDSIEWLLRAGAHGMRISVNFMGGEPLLRFPMLKQLVDWGNRRALCAGKKISWSLTTNMTLFNGEIREWVDQKGIGVLMSFDGVPEVQDTQRPSKDGKSKSQSIAFWAKSMLRTRPKSDARMTVSPQSVDRLYDSCLYLWEEIGFNNLVLADAAYEGWEERHFLDYQSNMARVVDSLVENFKSAGSRSLAILSYFVRDLVMKRDSGAPIERRNHPCGAGYNYSMIDYTGTIWPCHRFDAGAEDNGTSEFFKLGNIYHDEYNNALSNTFRNFDHSKIFKEMCRTCPVEPKCGGFCPAANLSDTGNMYLPHDTYCRLKQITYGQAENLYAMMKTVDPERCRIHFETAHAPRVG